MTINTVCSILVLLNPKFVGVPLPHIQLARAPGQGTQELNLDDRLCQQEFGNRKFLDGLGTRHAQVQKTAQAVGY